MVVCFVYKLRFLVVGSAGGIVFVFLVQGVCLGLVVWVLARVG